MFSSCQPQTGFVSEERTGVVLDSYLVDQLPQPPNGIQGGEYTDASHCPSSETFLSYSDYGFDVNYEGYLEYGTSSRTSDHCYQ